MGSAVLYLLLVVAAGGACPDGMQQLKVQLQWVSQPQFAGFQMPSSRDPRLPSYADECLQVSEGSRSGLLAKCFLGGLGYQG